MSIPEADRPKMSEANRTAIGEMIAAQVGHSAVLARAHLGLTRPDVAWDDLTPDEQAEAILTARPWFLAARAVFNGGCPRCGAAPVEIADLGSDYRECRDCGHGFEWSATG